MAFRALLKLNLVASSCQGLTIVQYIDHCLSRGTKPEAALQLEFGNYDIYYVIVHTIDIRQKVWTIYLWHCHIDVRRERGSDGVYCQNQNKQTDNTIDKTLKSFHSHPFVQHHGSSENVKIWMSITGQTALHIVVLKIRYTIPTSFIKALTWIWFLTKFIWVILPSILWT